MGCTSSSARGDDVMAGRSPLPSKNLSTSTRSNPLTATEIQSRIEAPKESQFLEIAGVKIKYAWTSQRGYYPEGLLLNVSLPFLLLHLLSQL